MLILGLNGSPNTNGNTAFMLNKALEAAKELGADTKLIHVAEHVATADPLFCNACSNPCAGVCYQGTSLGDLLELIKTADGIILGSPVYFGTVAAPMKLLWDKSRALRKEKALVDVVGAAISVGASRFGGQELTLRSLQDIMLVHGMTLVGDGAFENDPGHHGACAQRPADGDPQAAERCRVLGRRVAEVALATASLRKRKKG
ncbi:NADPH-dependent FMN reductase [Desulforamulus reducens MI-1]|uniref:NADPH-dependent FMN reductase n=1 Tax=Desulforamulus reducens (strain ATCC BAA-1160 / DSM 100696 / MI-1) TaxID=349161 RepID=A4J7C2_DESRM|nr:flavodoxin family protein [Desulforamulus reducens]ABO50975.1 NADPH-dependent FMN reductase [Desulforamulus reducens MI-1]